MRNQILITVLILLLGSSCISYVPSSKNRGKKVIKKEWSKIKRAENRIFAIAKTYDLADTILGRFTIDLKVPPADLSWTYTLNPDKRGELDSLLMLYSELSSRKEEKIVIRDKIIHTVMGDTSFSESFSLPVILDKDTLSLKGKTNLSLVNGQIKSQLIIESLEGKVSKEEQKIVIDASSKNKFIIILLVVSLIALLILYILEVKSNRRGQRDLTG
jgi:hypothetical protein